MKKSRFTEGQMVAILQEQDAYETVDAICRKNGINKQTFYRWRVGDEFVNDLSTPSQAYFLESRIYDNRGYCFQRLNRFREAVQDYSIALRLNPNNRKGLQRRSTCYKQLGDPRWQDDFRKAQTLPEN